MNTYSFYLYIYVEYWVYDLNTFLNNYKLPICLGGEHGIHLFKFGVSNF